MNKIEEVKVNIQDIVSRYNDWCQKQFPLSTPISSLKGLKRECDECMNDIYLLNKWKEETGCCNPELFNNAKIEYADCLMYLIDSARRFGLSLDDLFLAMDEKLQINLKRDWKINEDNSYSHIK